jgi:hydroxymethylbilane synthase
MRKLVLGTRGSPLALWQARHIAGLLRTIHEGLLIEERIVKTEGDIRQTAPLGPGDRGVFVRAIEEKLMAGDIDLAVHSLKDLPTQQPKGLVIAAVLEREDPRDGLLSMKGWTFDEVPGGTVIATGSLRRRAQLLHARPDLKTAPVRGNVDTRVRKLRQGAIDALVLAVAGIKRLSIEDPACVPIDTSICLPAVGQGVLGVETREQDSRLRDLAAALDHAASRAAAESERSFLKTLGGGCLAPATAFAVLEGGHIRLQAAVGKADGSELIRDSEIGAVGDAAVLGAELAARMRRSGADRLLSLAR